MALRAYAKLLTIRDIRQRSDVGPDPNYIAILASSVRKKIYITWLA